MSVVGYFIPVCSYHFVIAVWRKRARIRRMNPQNITLAIIATLSASIALADDFKTVDGKEYKDATVTHVEPDGIVVKTKSGITKLYFTELPKDVQQRFNYNPQGAAAYSAEQNAAMQKSSEQSAKEQAGIQSAQQQQQTAAVLQSRLQALYEEKYNTMEQIRLKDAASKNVKTGTHTGGKIDRAANPVKSDLPVLRDHRDAVEREIKSVREQLEQIQKTQH